jgi:hypothetical protein
MASLKYKLRREKKKKGNRKTDCEIGRNEGWKRTCTKAGKKEDIQTNERDESNVKENKRMRKIRKQITGV